MTATTSNTEIFRRAPATRTSSAKDGARTFSLTHVVEAAVSNIADESLVPLARHGGPAAEDARHLLAMLSWSYARQLYSSAQIQAYLSGGVAEDLWKGGAPNVAEIHRFRQENRASIEVCLHAALRFLAAQKLAEGLVTKINEAHLGAEAARRITMAMFIDSMEHPAGLN
jgi:transposase